MPSAPAVDQFGQEATRRGRAARQRHVRPEKIRSRHLNIVQYADESEIPARPGGAASFHHRLLHADPHYD
jgi:hypothetical protein